MEHVPIVLNFSHWEKAIQGDTCRISISEKFCYKILFFFFKTSVSPDIREIFQPLQSPSVAIA